jgi:hypothetical protein
MQKTITLKGINVKPSRKDSNLLNIGIKIEDKEGNDQWINCDHPTRPTWQVGDVITVEVRGREYNGKMYYYFDMPTNSDTETPVSTPKPPVAQSYLDGRVRILESQIRTLQALVAGKQEAQEVANEFNGEVSLNEIDF